MIMKIKINTGATCPERANPDDAGLDLFSFESMFLLPNEVTMLDTGISVKIPTKYVGLLFQRSSFTKLDISLANAVGVIDASYRGTIRVAFRNNSTKNYIINKGDKIAQLVVMPISLPDLVFFKGSDEEWFDTARGIGGFGSTGV
jgi:dUTP pyrophosphatase